MLELAFAQLVRVQFDPSVPVLSIVVLVDFRIVEEVTSKLKKRRNPSDFLPSVVVYSTFQCCNSWVPFLPSFISHHPRAAVTIVKVVAESNHAAGTRIIRADLPQISIS